MFYEAVLSTHPPLPVFFEESWTQLVVATEPYKQETIQRLTNDMDKYFPLENSVSIQEYRGLLRSELKSRATRVDTMRPLS